MPSDSGFIQPEQFSHDWQNISALQKRRDNIVYTAERYGRRFLLKTLQPECASLTEYRLQQEKEFRLGIALSHPNIAAVYSLEEVPEAGRCIVMEWIDGHTLAEWLQTKPSFQERKRVWEQLLDALAYLHANQRVHHDLKSSNILITRNGHNVKLIDFGLSDSDDSTCSVEQDVREDIRQLAPILRMLFPHRYALMARRCEQGHYSHIPSLQRAWQRRLRVWKIMPVLLAMVLLIVASIFFYMAYEERHAEQRKQQEMMAIVDEAVAIHEAELRHAVNSVDTQVESFQLIGNISQEGWKVRDSIIALYPENDPIRITIFDLWTQRMSEVQNEVMREARTKPLQ